MLGYWGISNNNKIYQIDSCIQSCLSFFKDQYSLKDRSTFCAWHRIDGMSCTHKKIKCFFLVSRERRNKGSAKKEKKNTRNSHHFHCQVPRKRMEWEHKHMSVKCGSREERKDEREEMRREERGEEWSWWRYMSKFCYIFKCSLQTVFHIWETLCKTSHCNTSYQKDITLVMLLYLYLIFSILFTCLRSLSAA